MPEASLASTTNLLHPRQVSELNETKAKLEGMLGAAPYIRNQLQDNGALAVKQIGEIDKMLEQAPQPIPAHEIDAAVKLEAELRERWLGGMPTQAEMRRNAPGCTDKHMAWEKRAKKDVLRWKHLRRRLHASGISEHRLADEGDISNIEMYRPVGGAQELSLDNAQIPVRSVTKLPPPGAGPVAVMSEADAALLKDINPGLLDQMGTFSNEQRAEVLALVRRVRELGGAREAGKAQVRAEPVRKRKRGKAARRAPAAKRPRTAKQLASDARLSETAKSRNADRSAKKAAEGG